MAGEPQPVTRVRAVLITPGGDVLVIRRVREGIPPYWVLPGGGIEPGDDSLESAVVREVREETGGNAELVSLIHLADVAKHGCHAIFLARIDGWSESARTGPEFNDPSKGQYLLDELPLRERTFTERVLRPLATSAFLAGVLAAGGDLFRLPDLREQTTLAWAPREEDIWVLDEP